MSVDEKKNKNTKTDLSVFRDLSVVACVCVCVCVLAGHSFCSLGKGVIIWSPIKCQPAISAPFTDYCYMFMYACECGKLNVVAVGFHFDSPL